MRKTRLFSHLILFITLFLINPLKSHAASVYTKTLYTGDDVVADGNGAWVCFDNRATEFVFDLVATENSGTGTLDVGVVTTSDKSHVSSAIVTFTQLSATGSEFKTLAAQTFVMKCMRAVIDVGAAGTPNYDISVKVHYRLAD